VTDPLDPLDPLDEHRAALVKIDEAVAHMSARAGDALTCKRGCDSCCTDGLSVLPVEAALIEAHAAANGARPPDQQREGMCAFLDDEGACTVYEARPVLCRTHGLAFKSESTDTSRGLRIFSDEVSACALNYTARAPAPNEVLDATKLMMLLVTVDRRYRARVGLEDDTGRVPLLELARSLRGTTKIARRTR
jgi:Fe-S-cluster containining protein